MRSLVWSTDIDVLPPDRVLEQRDGYLVVRSPSNPQHYWGNVLHFEDVPPAGVVDEWERLFDAELPDVDHRTFAWDRTDGAVGAAEEFVPRGYAIERMVGLVADADAVRAHARANPDVEIRALALDDPSWNDVVELQVAGRDDRHAEDDYRAFARNRLRDRRALFAQGRGSWYVALADGELAASLGIVVTDGRARYQAVDTAERFRRRGIASRLVVDAARDAAERFGARTFVIAADPGYHALGLYESLGFRRAERVAGVNKFPR